MSPDINSQGRRLAPHSASEHCASALFVPASTQPPLVAQPSGCLRRTTRLSLRGIEPFRDFVSVLQSGVTEIPAEVAYAGTGTVRYTW